MKQEKTFDVILPADAEIPTSKLSPVENMLGRWVKIPIALTEEEIIAPHGTQDLLADLYWNLYKSYPVDMENTPNLRQVNKALIDMVRDSLEWNILRAQTTASVSMSKLCAGGMLVNLLKDENIQKALQKQEQAQQCQQRAEKQKDKTKQRQGQAEANQLMKEAMEAMGKEAEGQDNKNPTQQAVGKAVKDAKEDSDTMRALAKNWGMEVGDNHELDAEQVAKMLDYYKNNARVRDVTNYMGRVKGISMATREQYSKVKGVTISRDGYTQNLQRMFPAEMALLRKDVNPLVRAQKASEYCDRGLLGMIEESKPVESGPLVIAVDESGSMSGEGILKAKGLALGICQSALENGQPFVAFGFSHAIHSRVDSNDKKTRLAEWALEFASGGTSFNHAIDEAVDIISESEHKHSADFVLITDGECDISPSIREKFEQLAEEHGTRMIAFGIDTRGHNSEAFEMADAYVDVDNLNNLDQLAEILTAKLAEHEREKK